MTANSRPSSALLVSDEEAPDISNLVIEDNTPVDNVYSEKQQRLLVEPLYASWRPVDAEDGHPRAFAAMSNVGVFAKTSEPPLVPDALLSMDVSISPTLREKKHRTYFMWEYGKPPDVVIEVVSNNEGDELGKRRRGYARMRVQWYVVWDPHNHLGQGELNVFRLAGDLYIREPRAWFETFGIGLTPWEGPYEDANERWLRWHDAGGTLIATGAESARTAEGRASAAEGRASAAEGRASAAEGRASAAESRAEALAARLRALGIDPDADAGSTP